MSNVIPLKRHAMYDGPCARLSCSETGPHRHPICERCGAVAYGNICCETCCRHHGLYQLIVATRMRDDRPVEYTPEDAKRAIAKKLADETFWNLQAAVPVTEVAAITPVEYAQLVSRDHRALARALGVEGDYDHFLRQYESLGRKLPEWVR